MSDAGVKDLYEMYKNQNYIKKRGQFFKKFGNKKYQIFDVLLKIISINCEEPYEFLDVGCGTGALLRKVKEKIPRSKCVGIDICRNEECESLKNIDYLIYDGENFPIRNRKFDVIFCTNMLYHVEDKKLFLLSLAQYLKKNGHIFITTKSKNNLPCLRKIHQEIIDEMNLFLDQAKNHVYSFCSENGYVILKSIFKDFPFSISMIPLTSTIIVDNMDELLSYVLSMPSWPLNNKEYSEKWREKISKQKLFFDQHIEVIYHISKQNIR